jgi:hypothetical protein
MYLNNSQQLLHINHPKTHNSLITPPEINLINNPFPPFQPPNILNQDITSNIHLTLCIPTDMRSDDDFRMSPEWVIIR